jgi:hypothetical protein
MGPTQEALALADFLIAKYGLKLDRYALAYAIMDHEEEAIRATTPQDAAGVETNGDETFYTLEGLITYGRIAGDDRQGAVPHYLRSLVRQMLPHLEALRAMKEGTTPPPGVDVGKLRELAAKWRAVAAGERELAKHHSVPARDAQAMHGLARILDGMADELAAIIDAAAPGVGNGRS